MHQNHLENFDSHSRKDQINMQMKMRSREMNKRLCRMGGRPMNGNNDMNFYEHFESHSPIYSPSNLPSNGENQINSSKSSSSHKDAVCISPSSPSQLHHSSKLQSPSSSNKTSQSQSVMAELLTENSNCQESQSKVERNSPTQDNSLKINKNSIDEKQSEANSERISTASPDNRPASVAMSPSHHYSNDSNSGDANHDQCESNVRSNLLCKRIFLQKLNFKFFNLSVQPTIKQQMKISIWTKSMNLLKLSSFNASHLAWHRPKLAKPCRCLKVPLTVNQLFAGENNCVFSVAIKTVIVLRFIFTPKSLIPPWNIPLHPFPLTTLWV